MLTKKFQLTVPTHISFTLYRYDHIDSIIISTILKECRNYSNKSDIYKIRKGDFINAIKISPRLRSEKKKANENKSNPNFKPNSIYFIFNILNGLTNLEWITFNVSHDKEYSRIVKLNDQEIINFYYKIKEGCVDLPKILNRENLDTFNMIFIKLGVIDNNYLNRSSYFYLNASDFIDIITMELFNSSTNSISDNILEMIDPKIDEDNPLLLIKTDYTLY